MGSTAVGVEPDRHRRLAPVLLGVRRDGEGWSDELRRHMGGLEMTLRLSSDELEVACDALWYVHGVVGFSPEEQALWDRLQPLRAGDYGGVGEFVVESLEAVLIQRALEQVQVGPGLDDDERSLLVRLVESRELGG